jgi:hypothetical protein
MFREIVRTCEKKGCSNLWNEDRAAVRDACNWFLPFLMATTVNANSSLQRKSDVRALLL